MSEDFPPAGLDPEPAPAEPDVPAPEQPAAEAPDPGPVPEDPAPAEPVSEPQDAAPVPPVDADPQQVAEQAAAAEPGEDPLLADVPETPGFLRGVLGELLRRVKALEGQSHAHE